MPFTFTCPICGKQFTADHRKRQFCSHACASLGMVKPIDEFWNRVDKTPGFGPAGDCWVWTGTKIAGYGVMCRNGKNVQAYRLSWELTYGAIPEGQCVLHHCDNKACVRVEHLFLGSDADNIRDMVQKKRHSFGERNAKAKLTDAKVRFIRNAYRCGLTVTEIAKMFHTSKTNVCDIVHRHSWKHLP